nr:hypothetical protein [uncultured Allomuricauda sp.]
MGRKHTTKELNNNANTYVAKETVYSAIEAQKKLGVGTYTAYIEADAFHGNPYSLLGRVILIRKNNGECPDGITGSGFISDYAPIPIMGIEIDEKSKIKTPLKRGSIVVTKELAASVSFLSYLSGEFSKSDSFSVMLYDNLTGLVNVHSPTWQAGLNNWIQTNAYLLQDPDICYLYAIVGIVQKHVIRKSYRKLDAKIKGGAYGINVNGEIHTSNNDFSLDIRYGLTPVIIKSPTYKLELTKQELVKNMALVTEMKEPLRSMIDYSKQYKKSLNYSMPNEDELRVFSNIKLAR